MIGIIPSNNKTFEVYGDFNTDNPIEGKLYYHPESERLFLYSKTETRANPRTGYFPTWNGKETFISNFAIEKYFSKDVTKIDIMDMCSNINKNVADQILYNMRRSENNEILKPQLSDGDNMFTQCIKGIINEKNISMVDLIDMAYPKLSDKIVESYYAALIRITFMRLDKWVIWVDNILHVNYVIEVRNQDKKLLTYKYPKDEFDTGIVKYDSIINTNDDPFKKIIKIIMVMENINKNSLKSDDIDDYTINNMMTTLNSKKSLSAQLFSRFIRMANLSYTITIYDGDAQIFEYKE